jgi:hypothetical protein
METVGLLPVQGLQPLPLLFLPTILDSAGLECQLAVTKLSAKLLLLQTGSMMIKTEVKRLHAIPHALHILIQNALNLTQKTPGDLNLLTGSQLAAHQY